MSNLSKSLRLAFEEAGRVIVAGWSKKPSGYVAERHIYDGKDAIYRYYISDIKADGVKAIEGLNAIREMELAGNKPADPEGTVLRYLSSKLARLVLQVSPMTCQKDFSFRAGVKDFCEIIAESYQKNQLVFLLSDYYGGANRRYKDLDKRSYRNGLNSARRITALLGERTGIEYQINAGKHEEESL